MAYNNDLLTGAWQSLPSDQKLDDEDMGQLLNPTLAMPVTVGQSQVHVNNQPLMSHGRKGHHRVQSSPMVVKQEPMAPPPPPYARAHTFAPGDHLLSPPPLGGSTRSRKALSVQTASLRQVVSAPNSGYSDYSYSGSSHSGSSGNAITETRSVPNTPKSNSRKTRRRKNNKQHNEEEYRRRTRIRERFADLRLVADCPKKDRFNILCTSIERIKTNKATISRLEQEKREIEQKYNTLLQQQQQQQLLTGQQVSSPPPQADSSTSSMANPAAVFHSRDLDYHIPMAVTTLDGHFVDCNPHFEQLVGLDKAAITARSLFAITHRDHLKEACAMVQQLLQNNARQEHIVYENDSLWVRPNNQYVPVHLTVSTVSRAEQNQTLLSYFAIFAAVKSPVSASQASAMPLSSSSMSAMLQQAGYGFAHHTTNGQQVQGGTGSTGSQMSTESAGQAMRYNMDPMMPGSMPVMFQQGGQVLLQQQQQATAPMMDQSSDRSVQNQTDYDDT